MTSMRGLEQLAGQAENWRKEVEAAAEQAKQLRDQAGFTDPDPGNAQVVVKVPPEKEPALREYLEAKDKYIQGRKMLENIVLTLNAERTKIVANSPQPVKIWEKADAPIKPVPRGLERLFR